MPTQNNLNTGSSAGDGTGDTLRAAASKSEDNFNTLYELFPIFPFTGSAVFTGSDASTNSALTIFSEEVQTKATGELQVEGTVFIAEDGAFSGANHYISPENEEDGTPTPSIHTNYFFETFEYIGFETTTSGFGFQIMGLAQPEVRVNYAGLNNQYPFIHKCSDSSQPDLIFTSRNNTDRGMVRILTGSSLGLSQALIVGGTGISASNYIIDTPPEADPTEDGLFYVTYRS